VRKFSQVIEKSGLADANLLSFGVKGTSGFPQSF
jgi:hypothetical protein